MVFYLNISLTEIPNNGLKSDNFLLYYVKRSNKIILIDNNQIILSASLLLQSRSETEDDYGFIRHLVLNTYRKYLSKFRRDYGELIICNDSKNVWRKDFFPNYKKNRSDRQKNQNLIGVKSSMNFTPFVKR